MKSSRQVVVSLFALLIIAGCASTKVTEQRTLVNEQLPRPDRIWVHDFVAAAGDVPDESGFAGRHGEHRSPQTAEQIATGRRVGAEIATHLVNQIGAMGLLAERASSGVTPRINDLVIRGYLLSIDEGSAVERVAIGLGSGTSEIRAAVEGYQMTARGLRRLGSGTVESGGSETPGMAVPAAIAVATANPVGLIVSTGVKVYDEESGSSTVEGRAKAVAQEIAEQMKPRFEQQGWIE
jgi:hypothetical protein